MKLALLFSGLMLLQPPAPPRDPGATPQPQVGATVRGRVTAAATGEPLHRVRVTLNGPASPPPTAVTDATGAFEIQLVPPGTYTATASRSGFLSTAYGQRYVGERGRSLVVAKDALVTAIDFVLSRGGVLAGRIVDESGTEYPEVRVEAVEMRYTRGRRVPLQAAAAMTDDLGEYRLSGLPPGQYLIRASATDMWQSADGQTTHAFAPTFYPSVSSTAEAETVSVSAGQEIANLDFAMRPGRAARILGILKDADAQPLAAREITLSRAERGVGGALLSTSAAGTTRTSEEGTFEFKAVTPGEFVIAGTGNERISTTVVLADGDERSVELRPYPPTPVTGVVIAGADGGAPPFLPQRLRVTPIAADPESYLPSFTAPGSTTVSDAWAFTFANLAGQYLFRVTGLPDDWALTSVRVNGKESADAPLAIARGAPLTGVQLVVSDATATVAGRVRTVAGAAAPDCTVIVFAADPVRWSIASRHIKVVRPDDSGRFAVAGLLPGNYRVIAQEMIAEGQWEDPAFLKSVAMRAVPFQASAGETATVDLRLERVQ